MLGGLGGALGGGSSSHSGYSQHGHHGHQGHHGPQGYYDQNGQYHEDSHGQHGKKKDGGLFSAANIEKGMQLGMAAMAMKGGHKGYKNQMKYDMGMKAMKKFF